jgi:four helix bundle protein
MQNPLLPHHKLVAYGVALQLLHAVREAKIRDGYLRDHAMRAAKSACLNTAEGAGRVSRPDKARAFTIARGEACEAAACVEIAVAVMHMPEAQEAVAAVIAEGKKMRRGFAIINDITEARPTSPEIAEVIKTAQTALFALGATKVIRIVGPEAAATSLQFARTQRESHAAYESYIAATLEDALKLLG